MDTTTTNTITITTPELTSRIEEIANETPRDTNTVYLDTEAQATARRLARGYYQLALVEGKARWSGTDLQGTVNRYGAESRENLLARFRDAGLDFIGRRRDNGHELLVIVWTR